MRFSALCSGLAVLVMLAAVPSFAAIPGKPDNALPDSYEIARVGDRPITVYAYRDGFFASDATLRPAPDSLGRITFLQDLVNKEVLGLTAQKTGYQFTFEDRAELREFHDQLLSNLLFIKTVQDSSGISEDSLKHVYGFHARELKLKLLYFPDRATAEYTRLQLVSGRMTWASAMARFGVNSSTVHGGLTDWMRFQVPPIEIALQIWPLRVGEVSPLISAASGYHLVQILDSRPAKLAPYEAMRRFVRMSLRGIETTARKTRVQTEAKQGLDLRYDSTNVAFASAHFRSAVQLDLSGFGTKIAVDENVPEFAEADTARTLATWKGGRLSLGELLHEYTDMQPMMRPVINTPERMNSFIDAIVLAPRMVEFAVSRGLERDSTFLLHMNRRREAILVSHMVDDSILSRVTVTKADRKAYYDAHHDLYTSYPVVRYAWIVRGSREAVDSVRAAIAAGASPEDIVAADQARHVEGSAVTTLSQGESSDYRKLLFEDLRPGKNSVIGPDKDKKFALVHELSYTPGSLLPYEQVESLVDESVRNVKGDQAVREFIARHAKEYAVVSHPELVMRIYLVDPASEQEW